MTSAPNDLFAPNNHVTGGENRQAVPHAQVVLPRRQPVNASQGLRNEEVAERVRAGAVNEATPLPSRTYGQILRANTFNVLNILLFSMAIAVFVFGSAGDALFGALVLVNIFVASFQEFRAKRTLERLAVLNLRPVRVVRDGELAEIAKNKVVLDDVVEITAGEQLCADGFVVSSRGLLVDESLLTGESDPTVKNDGDMVLSGSFVAQGTGRFQAAAVGNDAYASKLTNEARRFTLTRSELLEVVLRFVRYLTFALIPLAVVLFWRQLQIADAGLRIPVSATAAALTGLIPEGLVLMISVALGLGVVRLGRKNVLIRELAAVEGLARVDVICFDKTGTLTDGTIGFSELVMLCDNHDVEKALGAFAAAESSPNATLAAIGAQYKSPSWSVSTSTPFSSARKWSSFSFAQHGSWVLGAPEMLLDGDADLQKSAREQVNNFALQGLRVVVFGTTSVAPTENGLAAPFEPVALVVLSDTVREDAPETIEWLNRQGVQIRMISGDSPVTVGALAKRAGIAFEGEPFDARNLPIDPEELAELVETHTVFGRVRPDQKRAMINALKSRGHVVAMVGDGVNDVLALKDADMGIAMGNGSDATRAVAQIVLLNSEFKGLPQVTAEGRRVLANVERTTYLWGTKVVAAFFMAMTVAIAGTAYPYLPRQLSIINFIAVSGPAFLLALQPNEQVFRPGFFRRAALFSLPVGALIAAAVLGVYAIAVNVFSATRPEAATAASIVLAGTYLGAVVRIARPLVAWKLAMVLVMGGIFGAALAIPAVRNWFELDIPDHNLFFIAIAVAVGSSFLIASGIWWRILRALHLPGDPTDMTDAQTSQPM